jgi:hypothetical protein
VEKRKIDITGSAGNAFVLLSYAKDLCADYSMNFDGIKNEMIASDYNNLLNVFENYFGEYIELIRY